MCTRAVRPSDLPAHATPRSHRTTHDARVQLIAPAILERFTRKLNLADTAVLERTRFPDDQAAAALGAVMNPQRTMWAAAAQAVDMTEAMRATLEYVEKHQTSAMQKNPDAMRIVAGLLDRRPKLADFFYANMRQNGGKHPPAAFCHSFIHSSIHSFQPSALPLRWHMFAAAVVYSAAVPGRPVPFEPSASVPAAGSERKAPRTP